MDKSQKNTNKIRVFKYWFYVIFPKVRQDIWEYIKEHVALALVIFIATIVTSILSANGLLDKAISDGYTSDVSNLIRMLVALTILSLLYVVWSVIFYPAKVTVKKNMK